MNRKTEGDALGESGRGSGGRGMSLVSVDPGVLMVLPKDLVCATCQVTRQLLQDRDKEDGDAQGYKKKKARRGGAKNSRNGPRACSRASSSSPFQTPTPDDSGDEKVRDRDRRLDILSGGGGGQAGGAGGGQRRCGAQAPHRSLLPPVYTVKRTLYHDFVGKCTRILTFENFLQLPRCDSRASSQSESENDGAGGVRPGSRLSQGSCVSFAGSEIELELCATDCASYLAL